MPHPLKTALLLGAACAACCAPLNAPWLLGLLATGGLGLLATGEAWCALSLAMGLVAGWLYLRRRHRAAQAACPCPADAGCHDGNACALPGHDQV